MSDGLTPLPPQLDGVSWPTLLWPVAQPDESVDHELLAGQVAKLFARRHESRLGTTLALVVVHRGRIVAERYSAGVAGNSHLISWSTAKSMLSAVVGILVGKGKLDLDAPAAVPEWADPADPRHAITLRQLLEFRPGLEWAEDYVDDEVSDVITMLFGAGQADVGAFAANKPLLHEPGTAFCYSSGTSNIISRIVRDVAIADAGVDATDLPAVESAYRELLRTLLFDPLGMSSARPTFDQAGTWVASSYCHCTARDFARFALLFLRDGRWDGQRILPEGWVDSARAERSIDVDLDRHGAHWWLWDDNPWGAFNASGYEGQYLLVVPALDVVVVRLGKTEEAKRAALRDELTVLVRSFGGS